MSSGTCGLLKKTKNKKIHLKFFHLYHFLGQKRVFLALFEHEIAYTALKISKNTVNVWHQLEYICFHHYQKVFMEYPKDGSIKKSKNGKTSFFF